MVRDTDIFLTKSSKTELVIKSYHCSQMIMPRCSGHLSVTNKRVIFHGVAAKSGLDSFIEYMKNSFSLTSEPITRSCRIVKELDINTISGVSTYYGHVTNIFLLIMAVIFGLIAPIGVGVLMFKELRGKLEPTFILIVLILLAAAVLIAIGVAFLIFSRRPLFHLQIFSSQGTAAAITVGEGYGNLGGSKPLYALVGRPTKETDWMMKEIGAVISDVKELGDKAVELWFKPYSGDMFTKRKMPHTYLDDTEAYLAKAAKRL